MVVNHGLLSQNGITAITVDVKLLSLARNLAIRGIGENILYIRDGISRAGGGS